ALPNMRVRFAPPMDDASGTERVNWMDSTGSLRVGMALNRKTLEGRIRASQVAAAPTPAPSRPRMALVPSGVMPLGARCAMVVIEASRVVDDPLAAPVSSWMFEADEPQEASWYQTRLAIQVATDLQRSTPLNIIM